MLVMKFGGTSVGRSDRLQRIIQIIKDSSKEDKTVVVVSAMSGKTKKEGTTSRLLNALNFAEAGDVTQAKGELSDVHAFHCTMIDEIFKSGALKEKTLAELKEIFDDLTTFLKALSEIREVTAASRDRVIAVGEQLSAILLANYCKQEGVDAVCADLANVMEKKPNATLESDFFMKLAENAKNCIAKTLGSAKVAIATGFIGAIPGGIIENVGRGYSDYTAALLAAVHGARELQIWKEVDGIFSADPRKVEGSFILPEISFDEAAEMAFFGTEAIHPKTMEPCIQHDIPIRVKNVDNLGAPGTFVSKKKTVIAHAPKSVTLKDNIDVITINSKKMLDAPGFLARIAEVFNKHGVSIDLMATSEVSISCSVHDVPGDRLQLVKKDLAPVGEVNIISSLNSLSVIGHGMQMISGIAGKVFSAMGEKKINIVLISQGASELSISFVVDKNDGLNAYQALHDQMLKWRAV